MARVQFSELANVFFGGGGGGHNLKNSESWFGPTSRRQGIFLMFLFVGVPSQPGGIPYRGAGGFSAWRKIRPPGAFLSSWELDC